MPFAIRSIVDKTSPTAEIAHRLNEEPLIGTRLINVDLPADSHAFRYPHQLGRSHRGAWPMGFSHAVSCTPPDPANEADKQTVEIRNLTGIPLKNFPVLVI